MTIIIAIGLFIFVVLLIEGSFLAYQAVFSSEAKRVKRRVRWKPKKEEQKENVDIVRKQILSDVPSLNKLLGQVSQVGQIARLLEQAGSQLSVGAFVLLSCLLGVAGWAACSVLNLNQLIGVGMAGVCFMIPTVSLQRKKMKRLLKFETQLPDALDLIARALRAGHSLMTGMQMVGEEFSEPIGTEFERMVQEISFGVATPKALENLCGRVGSQELKFFVTALMVQWEIGGNLTEILETISNLIRQRFELLGRIKAVSAEGRLSAIILFSLPPVLAFVIFLVNNKYLETLVDDPIGHAMLIGGFSLMVLGGLVTRKMINIEV